MTYNTSILGTESLKKWSHCDGYLVESHCQVDDFNDTKKSNKL